MMETDLPLLYRILKPLEKNRLQKTAELISGTKLSVLDIGCSDGTFLFENKFRWDNIIGIDLDKNRLKRAKERNYGLPARFINKDFGRLKMPFKDNSFDLVVSIATLQYVYNLDLLFSEVFRVLKKGGSFIFEVPNMAVFWRRWQFLWGRLPRTSTDVYGWDAGVIHYFTCHDLERFVEDKGFEVERISCSGILDGLRQYWVSFLGADIIFVCKK
ncbi:class I SAM-dependent methyltransferase [Candidatus Gottesmanbacteria bacterium]|nr:class I SAM-dependent methyltransferase [Candidatus Gottesmanbacteria bacterium]